MMATESPVRMVESGGASNWPTSKNVATFTSQLHNMAAEDLEVLLKTHRLHGEQINVAPNRSGSAPPSIEGSFSAYGNLMAQQSSNLKSSMISFGSVDISESEEQMRADPAYFGYYYSNVNLNPRLPPPIVSRESRGIIGGLANNWRLTSYDDSGTRSLHFAKDSLSPHKEEPEDEKSDNCSENGNVFTPGYDAASLSAHHKSLVDLIQEDFPRTPSPLYNLSHSSSHANTSEELIDHDVQSISLENLVLSASKLSDLNSGSVITCTDIKTEGEKPYGSTSNEGPLLKESNHDTIADATRSPQDVTLSPQDVARSPQDVQQRNKTAGQGDKLGMLSGATKPDTHVSQQQVSDGKHMLPQQRTSFSQLGGTYLVQHGAQNHHVVTEGVGSLQQSTEEGSGHLHLSPPAEVQQHHHFLQSPGLTPPLYATATAYMSSGNLPFYPGSSHLSSGNVYAAAPPTQYGGVGGYTLNSSFLPQFVAGYHATGIHMQYDPAATTSVVHSFNGRAATSFSSGEIVPHTGGDMLQQQQGLCPLQMQPSFSDPLQMPMQMPYFQHSMGQDAYGGQYGWFASTNAFGGQDSYGSFSSDKQATLAAAYRGGASNQMFSAANGRRTGTVGSGYYGSPPITQFRGSPLGSPLLPGSPVASGASTPGRRNDLRWSQGGSNRNVGMYAGWQGQRGVDSFSDPQKKHSILDELKSCSARKIDLSDVAGRIIEFSVDQHGSRFIQQKLENCGVEEKETVFSEVLPHASKLMTDVFGNYVIQKFFEHGSREQRKQLADLLTGQILPLTFQMYGCRVIQKTLEVIELDQKIELVHELDGHVLRCVRDQNGNHVIQKCIESIPIEKIGFIISSFQGEVASLSTHPYGCRVIQRVLEHCGDEMQSQCIIDEILESAHILAQDQYGNYVAQHVLERGKPHERSRIISKLTGRIVQMSQHKYASNVVEKCLEHGDVAERECIVEEVLGQSDDNNNLLTMMKDQFANYVIQKILETSNDNQREVLLTRININLQALRKYTYGKHIAARFEQLCGEGPEVADS